MPDQITSSDFIPYLNQAFRVRVEGAEPIDLVLIEITEASPGQSAAAPGTGGRLPFSLHFLGPVSLQYLIQHTYRLEHEQMGGLDIFLVPLGPEKGRMRYEAVFN
jgi:hypothetical protein